MTNFPPSALIYRLLFFAFLVAIHVSLTSLCHAQYETETSVRYKNGDSFGGPELDLQLQIQAELLAAALKSSDDSTLKQMLRLLEEDTALPIIGQIYHAHSNEKDLPRKAILEKTLLRILQRETVPPQEDFSKFMVRDLIFPETTDYADLAAYVNLRKLSLRLNPYVNRQLKHLVMLKHLETLILPSLVNDDGLTEVGKLTSLNCLTLGQSSISDDGLQSLAGLSDLQYLDLSRCTLLDGTGLAYLQSLPRLETLVLPPRIEPSSIELLAKFPSLKYLEFNSSFGTQLLVPLKESKSLKSLRFRRSMVTKAAFWQMMVEMDPIRIEVEGMIDPADYTDGGKPIDEPRPEVLIAADIAALERHRLSDDRKGFSGGPTFEDGDMHRLDSLDDLIWLHLDQTSVSDEGMLRYDKIVEIERLVLPKNFTDDGIISLRHCYTLKDLDLRHTRVTDLGIVELTRYCHGLKRIVLPPAITSRAIRPISQFRLLEQIEFQNANVSLTGVEGLEPFKRLRMLRSMSFVNCGFTDKEQVEIKKQFPTVYVISR